MKQRFMKRFSLKTARFLRPQFPALPVAVADICLPGVGRLRAGQGAAVPGSPRRTRASALSPNPNVLGLTLCLCLLPGWVSAQPAPSFPRGHVFAAADFEGAHAANGWSGPVRLGTGFQSDGAILIERGADAPGDTALAQMALPVEKMRGHRIYLSAMVRAEGVFRTSDRSPRIKFMVGAVAGDEKTYEEASVGLGTFSWKPVVFQASVPPDATACSLVIGLQGAAGRVWFDNIRVSVRKPPLDAPQRAVTGPIFKGHDLPRLRGAMVNPGIDEDSLRVLGQEWNANAIRWPLIRTGRVQAQADPLDLAAFDQWLEDALQRLDAALPLCEKYGLMVVIDLHSPPGGEAVPGGYVGANHALFTNTACQEKFVAVWELIARRYRSARAVWGYDLANEPNPPRDVQAGPGFEDWVLSTATPPQKPTEKLDDWDELAERTAKAIRAIDPDRAIIVEPAYGFNPRSLKYHQPLEVANVVYSVHMYVPSEFTHQGIAGRPPIGAVYPGIINGVRWDKDRLRLALKPAVDFQKAYGVHLYIGEFSAIRWAPDQSAHRYLRDVIDIMEEHGWDWTYHAFREWNGWSVEHGSDPNDRTRAAQPTDREKLLREWFARNRKPAWHAGP